MTLLDPPKDIIIRFSKEWLRRETGFIFWKESNTFQMILSRWSFAFVNTDLILQKCINYLSKMHPLCDSLGFGAYCEEKLRSCKDITAYWEGYTADSDLTRTSRRPLPAQDDWSLQGKNMHVVTYEGPLASRVY